MEDYRRFNKTDWDAFAGAEKFSDSQEPFIWYHDMNDGKAQLVVVVDVNGIQVEFISDEVSEEPCVYLKQMTLHSIRAEGELRQLIKVCEEYTYAPDLAYELDHPTHEATKGFENVW